MHGQRQISDMCRLFLGQAAFVAVLAAALLSAAGCQSTGGYNGNPWRNDAKSDLLSQLERAEKGLVSARAQADQSARQVAQIQEQLDGQTKIQDILNQRIDNLLKENNDLHQELTAVVMNAAGTPPTTTPVSAIQQVGNPSPAEVEIPKPLATALAGLADNQAGMKFDPRERAVRIASAELFDQGDVLRPQAKNLLKALAGVLGGPDAKRFNFLIVAHAAPGAAIPKDWIPYHPTKWHLTAHQAVSVEQFLEECGLSPTRVGILSYGAQQPLVDGKDDASNRTNARVEIYITPPDPPARN